MRRGKKRKVLDDEAVREPLGWKWRKRRNVTWAAGCWRPGCWALSSDLEPEEEREKSIQCYSSALEGGPSFANIEAMKHRFQQRCLRCHFTTTYDLVLGCEVRFGFGTVSF